MAIPVSPIPGTFFQWEDQSDITTPDITSVYERPLYCAVFTSDKGKENWQRLSGQEWFDMYAVNSVVDFDKHGQPLLQTAMSINAGAEVLCKRVVADDASLANLAIIATVSTSTSQVTDSEGNLLYLTPNGEQTTTNDGINTPIMESNTSIAYSYKSVEEAKTIDEVIEAVEAAVEEDKEAAGESASNIYPLWIITDNGRGTSRKRIRILPNYQLSKNYSEFFLYDFQVIEGSTYFDPIHFCLNPDTINTGSNISLQYKLNTESGQVEAYQFRDSIKSFIEDVAGAIGKTAEEAAALDIIFGKNKKGKSIVPNITVDVEEGVDLSIIGGQLLMNGSNGSFGDRPIEAEGYGAQIAKAFAGYVQDDSTIPATAKILTSADGCYDPIIYNVDRYKIDAIFDANYPDIVKRAIEELVTFREDFFYFRDMGTKYNTIDLIAEADELNLHSKFCGTYCTYYDVIDPYSKKQITVSLPYHLSQYAVQQFNNGRNLPMAGIKYGFTITDMIEDTIEFIPTICPDLNEKEDLVDMRINYATYIDNQLVIETLYTSQEKYTQLSFINNILAVQQVIKAIRTHCPASRYSFIDGDDLAKYKAEVEAYIAPYSANFKKINLTYLEDPYYTENKIFYAALEVQFRDFVQTELFKITALASSAI